MNKQEKSKPVFYSVVLMSAVLLLFVAERTLNDYLLYLVTLIGIYGIMAISLTFVNGIVGLFSLGHAGFVAIGAYVSSLLTMSVQHKEQIFILHDLIWPFNGISIPYLPATILGGVTAAIFAFLIALPSLRLAGDYLAITTLGFSEIVRIMALNMTFLTNGALGLKDIPAHTNIWWSWGWLLATVLFITGMMWGSFGRAFRAIRSDRIAAASSGINVFKHQLIGFVIGGFFAGVAGSLYAHFVTVIDPKPTTLGIMLTFNILIMIVIGGLGSIAGAIIGAGLFVVMTEALRFLEGPMNILGIRFNGVLGMRMLVMSALFVLVMIRWPRGIMGGKEGRRWMKS